MPQSKTKQLIDNQRTIETEADILVIELRREIAKLSELMYSLNDAAFSVLLNRALTKLRDILDVNDLKIKKVAIELTSELNGISKAAAGTALAKAKPPGIKQIIPPTIHAVRNEMKRMKGQNYANHLITQAIIGKRTERYLDGLLAPAIRGTATNSRTISKASVEVAKNVARRKDSDAIGYIWVSVLDSRTSTICQDLSSKRFYYNRIGGKVLPPAHPNCRSSTEPISKKDGIPEIESFVRWAKDPDNQDELREALGKTRYELFTAGKLKIERFNNAFFKPLTLKQMKKQNAIGFERIGQ